MALVNSNRNGQTAVGMLAHKDLGFIGNFMGSGVPLLDQDTHLFNLIASENQAELNRSKTPSGMLTEINEIVSTGAIAGQIEASGTVANELIIKGVNEVIMNGYKAKITRSNDTNDNKITLNAPPTTLSRVDVVFLEMWFKEVAEPLTSSVTDRRAAGLLDDGTFANFGNVDFFGSALRNGGVTQDLVDPAVGLEAYRRIQLQYRFRVVDDINIASNPVGLTDTAKVFAWPSNKRDSGDGVAVTGINFTLDANDAGLYIGGTGSSADKTTIGSFDGFIYALPICVIHRRNTTTFNPVTNGNGAEQAIGGTSERPDGLFNDQIAVRDIHDLRHQVSLIGFDFGQILDKNIEALRKGTLRTSFITGDASGTDPSIRGTELLYAEQVGTNSGEPDPNNVHNRSNGNNESILNMDTNGQRRNWNDQINAEKNHSVVTKTLLAKPSNVSFGAIRTTGASGAIWDNGEIITVDTESWASINSATIIIWDQTNNIDVSSEFGFAASSSIVASTINAAYVDTFTSVAATDILTLNAATTMLTGAKVQLTGSLASGLASATDYFIIRLTPTTIKLATSEANARADTPIVVDITADDGGSATVTEFNPSFAQTTNLSVTYDVDYPVGGGLVHAPSNIVQIGDEANLLWNADSGLKDEPSYLALIVGTERLDVIWNNTSRFGAIFDTGTTGVTASGANTFDITLPSGYTCSGLAKIRNATGSTDLETFITNWVQASQVVTITTSSGVSINDVIEVQLYITRRFTRFQEETRAILDTYVTEEISITTDANGDGVTFFDYGDVGLQVADMYGGIENLKNDADNTIDTTGTVVIVTEKITVTGSAVTSGIVNASVVIGRPVLGGSSNNTIRTFYEYIPYAGTNNIGSDGNILSSNFGVTTEGTGAFGDSNSEHRFITGLPLGFNFRNYNFLNAKNQGDLTSFRNMIVSGIHNDVTKLTAALEDVFVLTAGTAERGHGAPNADITLRLLGSEMLTSTVMMVFGSVIMNNNGTLEMYIVTDVDDGMTAGQVGTSLNVNLGAVTHSAIDSFNLLGRYLIK